MKLTVTKMEPGGVSTVNKITPCAECDKFTHDASDPLIDICLWLASPRGATTFGARLPIHASCLQRYITHAQDVAARRP